MEKEGFSQFKRFHDPRISELVRKQRYDKLSPEEEAELASLREFPENQRAQELMQKVELGTATTEERAELGVIHEFPNNLKGQQLKLKYLLGTATDEEIKSLRAHRSAQIREALKEKNK